MKRFTLGALLVCSLLALAPAQMQMGSDVSNTTEMVTSAGAPTNGTASLKTNGDILIGNNFGVWLVVEIRSAAGDLLFSVSVPPNDFVLGPHGLPPGTHEVRVCDAGTPPPQKCGCVTVN